MPGKSWNPFFRIKSRIRAPLRLGDRLCQDGIITTDQLQEALEYQSLHGSKIGSVLVYLGYLDEARLLDYLSETYRVPSVLLGSQSFDPAVTQLLPLDWLEKEEVLPLMRTSGTLTLAMTDPSQRELINSLEKHLNLQINPVVVAQSSLKKVIGRMRLRETLLNFFEKESPPDRDRLALLFSELTDYEVIQELGQGGFAKVFKCLQKSLERYVAIKTLSTASSPYLEVIQRFRREGKIVAQLRHPNIVSVFDQGEIGDTLYIVMEYVEGCTLDQYMKGKSIDDGIRVFIQVCDALAAAHAQGILHRDIKPANILVNTEGQPKLLDFGIACHIQTDKEQGGEETNFVLGTPRYMSPEQRDQPSLIDEKADLYSLAAVMFEIFTHSSTRPSETLDPQAINPDIPPPLSRAIQKCLAADPNNRLSNIATLRQFLVKLLESRTGIVLTSGESQQPLQSSETKASLIERYEILSELRSTKEGKSVLAKYKTTHQLIVIRHFQDFDHLGLVKSLSSKEFQHVGEILGVGGSNTNGMVVRLYYEGGTLGEKLRNQPRFTPSQAVDALLPVVHALDEAQKVKCFHGHLHPENIVFDEEGNIKVVDFALPPICEPSLRRFFERHYRDPVARDRFSLGVLLFEMLTGRQYLSSKIPEDNLEVLKNSSDIPPSLIMIVRNLWNLVAPEKRFPDYRAILYALEQYQVQKRQEQFTQPTSPRSIPSVISKGQSIKIQRIFWIVATSLLLLITGLVLLFIF